jgi:predicted aldo/keto reductase-like oxidoreductase
MNKTHQAPSRRQFLIASALAAPALLSASPARAADAGPAPNDNSAPLPKRKLGKNGPEVTILNLGGMMKAHGPDYLDLAWSMGIRYFDTADCYMGGKSEKHIGEWLKRHPDRRKDLFLVTKDHPGEPKQLLEMIDRRLENCGTDYIDLFFIHGLGSKQVDWPKEAAFKSVCQKLKSSGKCRMVGFSCHDNILVTALDNAAEGGFVDAIMLKYNVFFEKGDAFDLAVDACHKAGIGLVAMKEMRMVGDVPKKMPEFESLGINTHQAILYAVWSDPRIASVCSAIETVTQMEENTAAARSFKKPLDVAARKALRDAATFSSMSLCPGCPSCREAGQQHAFAFDEIARYVAYYEQDAAISARDAFHGLSASARDASAIDLAALKEACHFGVDYPEIVRRAHRYFA